MDKYAAVPRIQKVRHKNLDIDRFLDTVAMAAGRGVFTHGFTMLGFSTETDEELKRTIDVATQSRLHTATLFTVIPYPETELRDCVTRTCPERIANLRYESTDCNSITVNLSDVPDKVLFARQREAWRRFYMRPERVWRILRDYPRLTHFPSYVPLYALRLLKGLRRD